MATDGPCNWPEAICPISYEGDVTVPVSDGPYSRSHKIRTSYMLSVGGVPIPIVRTVRDFSVQYSLLFGTPGLGSLKAWKTDLGEIALISCLNSGNSSITGACSLKEECVIEKSTLHYLDQRYGVCLYRYQKDEIHLDKVSTELALFKTPDGGLDCNQVQIKTADYTASSTVEWRLVVNGVLRVLNTGTVAIHPFGGMNNGQAIPPDEYVPDPNTRKILVFPQPPSLALPLSPEIKRLGFYDYGNLPGGESDLNIADGGMKDMYYPEWCRNLQEDPIWRAAADRRYDISWRHAPLIPSSGYTPPPITVDPMPIGSFVKHPKLGEIYQFLIDSTAYTSPSFNALLDTQLPEGDKTHDTTLYFPISII